MSGNASPPSPHRRQVRLGLVADAGVLRGAHVPLLPLQRAGWGIAWMDEVAAETAGLPVGLVVPPGARLPTSGAAEVWLRGDHSAAGVAGAVSRLRALEVPLPISVDVLDRAGLEPAHRLGVTPVLGPAPLGELLALAAAAAAANASAGGLAVLLPISVGRTDAEARARLHRDPWLAALDGSGSVLVGTLEACQDAVVSLAHAGVTDLRLRPAVTPDLPDVLAQLSALGRSPLDRLRPGAPRSPAPPAPADWGGRPG
jgi:hypothetical protein